MNEWLFFFIFLLPLLAIDLFYHRKKRPISFAKALLFSLFWIGSALVFNGYVVIELGEEKGLEFFSAYLLEKSLSIDNVFVFYLIFQGLFVPKEEEHAILFWGVLGAMIMRALFIGFGIALLSAYQGISILFGLFLMASGAKFFFKKKEERPHDLNYRLIKNLPLFWKALILVEFFDLIFAIDSIPAVLAITRDPYIAFTSNIFAVLGLRSLYFVIKELVDLFAYLHYALAAILIFIGFKMIAHPYIEISTIASLLIILTTFTIAIFATIFKR